MSPSTRSLRMFHPANANITARGGSPRECEVSRCAARRALLLRRARARRGPGVSQRVAAAAPAPHFGGGGALAASATSRKRPQQRVRRGRTSSPPTSAAGRTGERVGARARDHRVDARREDRARLEVERAVERVALVDRREQHRLAHVLVEVRRRARRGRAPPPRWPPARARAARPAAASSGASSASLRNGYLPGGEGGGG